jgi:hypothetical protein
MSAIVQASPVEKLAQEPLPTGDSCVPGHFWSFGRSDEAEADPGPLQLGM